MTGASFWACLWIAVLANIVVGNAILQLPRTVREWKQTQHAHQSVPEVCWLVIDTNAPDVAPMSYPNNSPPIAGNRNTRDVMSQSTSRGVRAAADMSVCGASCNSKKSLSQSRGPLGIPIAADLGGDTRSRRREFRVKMCLGTLTADAHARA